MRACVWWRRWARVGGVVGLLGSPGATRAEGREATCDRLASQAAAEAALLYAPRVQLEAARAPRVLDAQDPTAPVGGLQARAALAFSATDALRGRAVERVALAECTRERASAPLEALLALGARLGELESSHAELAVLRERAPAIDLLVREASDRLAVQRATAVEVLELRERRGELARRTAELRDHVALLEPLAGPAPAAADLAALVRALHDATLAVDRGRARVDALGAWRVDMRAGVAGGERADWFAVAELGYAFGRPWQAAAQRRAIAARDRELTTDDRAIAHRVAQLQGALRGSVAALTEELQALDDERGLVAAEQARLAQLTDPGDGARHLRARLTLQQIQLDARRAAIEALISTRRPLAGAVP